MPPPYGILKFTNDEEMETYFDRMRGLRREIEMDQGWTYGEGSTLNIISSLENEDPQEGLGTIFSYTESPSKADSQSLPYDLDEVYRNPRPLIRRPLYPPSLPKVTLTRPLSTGEDLNSQVWVGAMEFPGSSPMQVVVKIFDHVMQKPCSDRRIFFGPIAEYMDWWMSAGEMFMRELWTYKKLESLQGKLLPRSYGFFNVSSQSFCVDSFTSIGFFQVKLPCGEEAPCHVMEFIDGTPLKTRVSALGGFSGPQAATIQTTVGHISSLGSLPRC